MRVAIIADIILLIKQSNEQAPHGIDAINATVIHSGDGLTVASHHIRIIASSRQT